jgi:hypothetical protein
MPAYAVCTGDEFLASLDSGVLQLRIHMHSVLNEWNILRGSRCIARTRGI